MKMPSRTICATFFLLSAFAAAAAEPVDITPLFPKAEAACALDTQMVDTLRWLTPNEKGVLQAASAAPALLQKVLVKASVKDEQDYWQVSTDVSNAQFKGLNVVRIDRWTGKDNGINGYALVFADKLPQIATHIKTPKKNPNSETALPFLASEEHGAHRAMLVCDFSD